MQPPPPAGCTGRAPPGAGGGAGVTFDDGVGFAARLTIPASDQPNAKTSAAKTPQTAATGWACRIFTISPVRFLAAGEQSARSD